MTLFNRIRKFFHSRPDEQVLGYSPSELQVLFPHPATAGQVRSSRAYPQKSSLDQAGIHAVYAALLIDKGQLKDFMTLVNKRFVPELTREFRGMPVIQNKSIEGDARLCFLIVDEFKGNAVKYVTDSVDFLTEIDRYGFSPPPPWVTFKDYNPEWWGGSMQGEQGYYDEYYFSPFFSNLDAAARTAYCKKYGASQDWERVLELFYDEDNLTSLPRE